MATGSVPAAATSDATVQPLWIRSLARAALALLSFWALSYAADRFLAFLLSAGVTFRYDVWPWLTWAAAMIAAGLLFGLATCLPLGQGRFVPSRLVLAAVALVPIAHSGWWFLGRHAEGRLFWFDQAQIQFVMAGLAGVAIASTFTDEPARRAGRWFRLVVRAALVALAFAALWFATDRFVAFFAEAAHERTSDTIATPLNYDYAIWLLAVGAMVSAGLLFGLATWLPFAKIRVLPSRLVLAAMALLPVAHFWWTYLEGHGATKGWSGRMFWFDTSTSVQFVAAALAGIAIASAFRTAGTGIEP